MSNNYGPRIVTDGLVLCLDAADRNSYPGSGSTWYDLSGNNYNGTISGATFTTFNNNGVFYFYQNDSISFSSLSMASYPGTISAWCRFIGNDGYVFSVVGPSNDRYYILYNSSNELHLVRGTSYDPLVIASSLSSSRFYNITMTYSNNTLYGYLDGVYVSSKSFIGAGWTNNAKIGRHSTGSSYLNGYISNFTVHDRILSADEVRRNYNATKGRFGL
jgi:hypothetical protein